MTMRDEHQAQENQAHHQQRRHDHETDDSRCSDCGGPLEELFLSCADDRCPGSQLFCDHTDTRKCQGMGHATGPSNEPS